MSSRPWTSEPTKATPVAADQFLILDSADSNVNKRVTVSSLPTEFTGAWTATHNANGQTLDNVGALVSNAATPAGIGQIRLGNGESIAWREANNVVNATLTFTDDNQFSFSRDLTMTGNFILGVGRLTSNTANPAGNGIIRLANSDAISWRNMANTSNHQIQFVNDELMLNFAGNDEYTFGATGANWEGNALTNLGRTNFNQDIVPYNATQVFDFDANQYRQITLTGNLTTLSTSNRAAGKTMSIIIVGDATVDRTITFNLDWHHNPSDPSVIISAGAFAIMSFYCTGADEADVIVAVSEFE